MFKYFVGACLAIVVSFSSYANEGDFGAGLSCPTQVEELYEPLSQRIVLAMFGKDASLASLSYHDLTDAQIASIEGMSDRDVSACASPMPSYTSTAVISILHYLYWVTLVMWVIIIVAYSFDSSYLSMGRNNDRDAAEESPLLKIVRASIAMMFTAPLMSLLLSDKEDVTSLEYASIHKLMFMAVGKSIGASEAIDASLKQKHISNNPVYSLPEPDYALKTGSFRLLSDVGLGAMLNFATCAVASNRNQEVNLSDLDVKYLVDSDVHQTVLKSKYPDSDCFAKIEMPSDISTIEKAKSLIADYDYDLVDFERLERETYANLVQQLLDLSLGMAAGLASNLDSDTYLMFSNTNLNEDLSDLKFWTEACPTTYDEALNFGKKYPLDSEGKLTEQSYYSFQMLAERCLSYAVVTKLGYPKHPKGDMITDPQSRFGNTLYKYDAAMLSRVDDSGNNVFVFPELDYMRKLEGRQHQACSYTASSVEDGIQSCTEKVCKLADATGKVSGLFECAVMIDKANADGLTKFYSSLGFIATPATMMSTLGSSSVPDAPQLPLKNFAILSQVSINKGVIGDSFYRQMRGIRDENKVLVSPPPFTYTDYKLESSTYDQAAYADVLTCLVHPSSVIEKGTHRVICEHPLNEIHDMGIFILKMFSSFSAGVVGRHMTPFASKLLKNRANVKDADKNVDGGLAVDEDVELPDLQTPNAIEKNTSTKNSTKGFKKVLDTISPYVGAGFLGFLFSMLLDGKIITPPTFITSIFFGDDDNPYWHDSRGNLTGMGIMAGLTLGYMVSGEIEMSEGSKVSKEEKAAVAKKARNVTFLGTAMLIIGFVAAFIVPLAPLAIFYAALFAVLANILANIFSANFQVIYALANTGKDVRKKLTSMFNKWLLLVLRLPLLVVGFYMSMSLMLTILPDFALAMTEIIDRADMSGFVLHMLVGVVKWILGICLFLGMYIMLMFALMDGISAPFNLTRGLIFNDDSGQVMGGEDSQEKLKKNVQLFKNL